MSPRDAVFENDPFPTNDVYADDRVTAFCSWGTGSDVTLHDRFADRDGKEVYLDMTAGQALDLAAQLVKAARQALGHDQSYLRSIIDECEARCPGEPTDPSF